METTWHRSVVVALLCVLTCAAGTQTARKPGPTSSARPARVAAVAAELRAAVDPRIELMSIIFHLAGNGEYNQPRVKGYADDVERHFGPFSEHRAVQIARRLRSQRGVGFDAPMSLAVHLADAKSLRPLVSFDPPPAELDQRWTPADVAEFLDAASAFAKDAKFEEFFSAHRELYSIATRRMDERLRSSAHLEWFELFFGARPEAQFHLVLGMLNGGSCYGPRAVDGGHEELYCILGVWETDDQGQPSFSASVLPTVVHEFSHSYANPLIDRNNAALQQAGERLFAAKREQMRRQAYGNGQTVLRESLVRACVVRYRHTTEGVAAGLSERLEQARRGFAWVGELSNVLANDYERHRDQYPTLEAFMPRVVTFFDDYAKRFDAPAPPPTSVPATAP